MMAILKALLHMAASGEWLNVWRPAGGDGVNPARRGGCSASAAGHLSHKPSHVLLTEHHGLPANRISDSRLSVF